MEQIARAWISAQTASHLKPRMSVLQGSRGHQWSRSLLRQEKRGRAQGPWHKSRWARVGLPAPLEHAALHTSRRLLGLCARAARGRPRLQGSWAQAGESGRLGPPRACSAGEVRPPQQGNQRLKGRGLAATKALTPGPPAALTETAPQAAAALRIPRSLRASSCFTKAWALEEAQHHHATWGRHRRSSGERVIDFYFYFYFFTFFAQDWS